MLARVKRGHVAWGVAGLLVVAAAAMYWLNPFHVPSRDPRARVLGYMLYRMPSLSMEPTIHQRDLLLVNTAKLRNRDPQVGEIIAFWFPPAPDVAYIKRVVATGGSLFEMRKGVVYLDGKPLAEPYLPEHPATEIVIDGHRIPLREDDAYTDYPPMAIPAHYYFVLGDSRSNSEDSRVWGLVPRENVIGVYVPL